MYVDLKPLIDEAEIDKKARQLAAQITKDYQDKPLLCVGILKGSVPFFTKLTQYIDLPLTTDFICVSSYGKETRSSGEVKMVLDLGHPIEGKHILLVEDIVDTGLTLHYLFDNLKTRHPASIKVASLLLKPTNLKKSLQVDYLGFEIGDQFVVGFGLDYAEKYRNLPFVAVLPPELIEDSSS